MPQEDAHRSPALDISEDWGDDIQEKFSQKAEAQYTAQEAIEDAEYDEEYDYDEGEGITVEWLWSYFRWPLFFAILFASIGFVFHMYNGVTKTTFEASKVAAAFGLIAFGLSIGLKGVVEGFSDLFRDDKIMWSGVALAIGVATADHFDLMSFTLPMIDIAGQAEKMRVVAYLAIGLFAGALVQELIFPTEDTEENT